MAVIVIAVFATTIASADPCSTSVAAAHGCYDRAFALLQSNPQTMARWIEVGEAFDRAAASDKLAAPLHGLAVDFAVDAWKQAVDLDPAPHGRAPATPTEERLLAALRLRRGELAAGGSDWAFVSFDLGHRLARHELRAEAITTLESLVERSPRHDAAEHGAMVLLDILNQAQRFQDLATWTNRMLGTHALLARRNGLRTHLLGLRHQVDRKTAETQARAGSLRDCAATYLAIHARDPKQSDDDEILYNAMVCQRGDAAALRATFRLLLAAHPHSRLLDRARRRLEP